MALTGNIKPIQLDRTSHVTANALRSRRTLTLNSMSNSGDPAIVKLGPLHDRPLEYTTPTDIHAICGIITLAV